jgi:hypothetical protein
MANNGHHYSMSCTLLAAAVLLHLNDGWMGEAGSPKLMSAGHPTVRMTHETIQMKVSRDHVDVDCRFIFVNEGNATAVRIGFPDDDSDFYIDPKKGPQSVFTTFSSWVDGAKVPTRLMLDDDQRGWQVKTVIFGRNQTRRIRNSYRLPLGSLAMSGRGEGPPAIFHSGYILHTGGSWKGNIGQSEIIVTFADDAPVPKGPLKLAWNARNMRLESDYWKSREDVIHGTGPGQAEITNRTIRLTLRNWRPRDGSDDLHLYFGPHERKIDSD